LVQLQKDGMIKNIGVSITSNDQLQQVIKIPEIKMIQMPFNVLDNFSRRGILLVKAREAGKILYARSAYLQGLLLMSMEKIPAPLKSVIPLMRQLQQIANRRRITVECLCLGYVLQQKLFDGLIIGVDNKDQLIKNWQSYQSASRVEIDLAEINRLIVDDPRILDPNQWQTL
jgi:aryl-alcohol dehydrogenase-like predicted oxidoreductase